MDAKLPKFAVLPGMQPNVTVPCLTVMLAEGMIRIPQRTVLAEVHLPVDVLVGLSV